MDMQPYNISDDFDACLDYLQNVDYIIIKFSSGFIDELSKGKDGQHLYLYNSGIFTRDQLYNYWKTNSLSFVVPSNCPSPYLIHNNVDECIKYLDIYKNIFIVDDHNCWYTINKTTDQKNNVKYDIDDFCRNKRSLDLRNLKWFWDDELLIYIVPNAEQEL